MKLWRKMGNKVVIPGTDIPLTGRQYKKEFPVWNFRIASDLMTALAKRVPYNSPYVKEEK